MTKPELLKIMRLLSALESALMYDMQSSKRIPDYLLEDITLVTEIIEREILNEMPTL